MNTLESFGHRQQTLLRHLLHAEQGLTLDQLAQHLAISRNAVMQHITALEKFKCIDNHYLPSQGGRPSKAYVLNDAGKSLFPKQYSLFSKVLLEKISQQLPAQELEGLLSAMGEGLALAFKNRVENSDDTIEEVRIIMRELGYETQSAKNTESTEAKNEIIAKNCVFHDLASNNNAVCELDRSLISSLLDKKVEQKECMVKGGKSCRFCISSH